MLVLLLLLLVFLHHFVGIPHHRIVTYTHTSIPLHMHTHMVVMATVFAALCCCSSIHSFLHSVSKHWRFLAPRQSSRLRGSHYQLQQQQQQLCVAAHCELAQIFLTFFQHKQHSGLHNKCMCICVTACVCMCACVYVVLHICVYGEKDWRTCVHLFKICSS